MKLLDTNIFLEILLEQEKAQAAVEYITSQDLGTLFLSNYSLDSIGLKLFWSNKLSELAQFGQDLNRAGIRILALMPEDFGALTHNIFRWGLDFDDAYQYTLAKKHGLELVSFDADFDRTDLKRIEPQ
ncbi:MAG: PIN domain-containing protein [Chloroherpetonaceae bacterium]|nr:PIN domain-containing protein [Chloroherpetonaceae bacterium]MCS7211250.1 PIN domain-containing protein [Chloroherpetonaceae bacterium]MDW8019237.1 PIN domain-containing protein [Chloroherpetonaceae bacterium]MDW8464808.1 PIN domain-containing protein [Chloroherpetonaceae bacterium]